MKQKICYLLLIPLALSFSSCTKGENKTNFVAGDDLTLTSIEMCDYYGECTLLQYGDYDLVIDSGSEADAYHVKEVLDAKIKDKTIDLLIVTHPHGDHFGGIIAGALSDLRVNTIVDYGYTYNPNDNSGKIDNSDYVKAYTSWRDKLIQGGTTYYPVLEALKEIPTVNISKENDCYLKWLKNDYYVAKGQVFPNSAVPSDNPNTTSVSCYVQYKKWNIVLCGDIDSSFAEMSILTNHSKLFKGNERVMLKATHHGSSSSMGSAFLDWCHPELMYVSAAMVDNVCIPNQVALGSGKEVQSHPSKSTLKRMTNRTNNIYWNGINGDLTITVDGVNDANITGSGRKKNYYKTDGSEASIEDEKNVKLVDSAFYSYFTGK